MMYTCLIFLLVASWTKTWFVTLELMCHVAWSITLSTAFVYSFPCVSSLSLRTRHRLKCPTVTVRAVVSRVLYQRLILLLLSPISWTWVHVSHYSTINIIQSNKYTVTLWTIDCALGSDLVGVITCMIDSQLTVSLLINKHNTTKW